jgi:hypothetical protein
MIVLLGKIYDLTRYGPMSNALTARELRLFTRLLVVDGRLPSPPANSTATPYYRQAFLDKISSVGPGAPERTEQFQNPRCGEFNG